MKNIAIITARGGSKRIPRKNIKLFCGIPIIAYSIRAALASHIFEEVMVSTDDKEIAMIAKKYGASIPFMRSKKNSDDYSTTGDVLAEVIEEYKKIGKQFDYICCIYPTAPFVTAEKLVNAYKKLMEENADSLVPVVRFSYPPQRCFMIDEGKLEYKYPQYIRARSQDLEPLYHDVGQFYFAKTECFLQASNNLVTSHTIPYLVPETEVQDIDNLDDWKLAEMKYRNMDYQSNYLERLMAMHESQYESYFVCFVDILGMKNAILKSRQPSDLTFLNAELNALKEANLQYNKHLFVYMFSDCMYIAAKEKNIVALLEYVSLFTWRLLNEDDIRLLRGGLSFGQCYCSEECIIGPAMVDAYLLENQKGAPPWIFVDSLAQKRLHELGIDTSIKSTGKEGFWWIDFIKCLEKMKPDTISKDNLEYIRKNINKKCEGLSKSGDSIKDKYEHMKKIIEQRIKLLTSL